MVDQAIMGNMVKILYENEDWYLCQTHYDYVGWITKSAVHQCNTDLLFDWEKNAKYRIKTLNAIIYSQPNRSSTPVSDGVLNNRLNISENLSEWYQVTLPDGRVGFIDEKNVELINNGRDNEDQNEHIISTALSMKGIPYLWGGNSSKGNDCSGFTQTVFKAAGIQLPRDARQQAQIGKPVKKKNLKKGDLLFFGSGERVTHVGISMGVDNFIHQGSKLEGKVDIHSLNPDSPNFNSYRKETFLFARRITTSSNDQ
jgi:cell wall-associated NlpC family hydrolase